MFVRLENLFKYETVDKSLETGYTKLTFQKIGLTGHVFVDIQSSIVSKLKAGDLLFVFPEGFRPKQFNIHLIVSFPSGKPLRTSYDKSTGRLTVLTPTGLNESIYFSNMYILD